MDLRKDIYFYTDIASFPIAGAPNVLYIDKATGLIYTWSGVEYSASGAGGLNYLGLWDANVNSPAISSGVGATGDYYIVGTAGNTNIDGISDWGIGDWIIFGGITWQKIDNSENPIPDLGSLGDVNIISPLDGDVLTYDGATGLWKNETPNNTPAAQTVLFADLSTTEALKPCIYSNGALGVGATLTGSSNGQLSTVSFTGKIDNVATALGQVILVQLQTDKRQNGLYVVTQLGDGSNPFILTRSTDADTQAELYPLQINIFSGATLANRAFLQKTADPIIGTDNIVFTTSAIGLTNTPVRHVDTVTSTALPACAYTSGTNLSLPGIGAYLEANVNGSIGTINGIALVTGNRILVKDQANQAHNGDYVVSNAGSVSAKWKLVRVSAWGAEFVRLEREWKVNNPSSTKYGARYSTSLSSLANSAVGTTNIVLSEVANAGGRFGIADSTGTYTYYTTLTLAMAAATAGQTIEMFTDYTESGAVTITLKNNVNINGNGHTYNYTNATGNCFIDNAVAVTCVIQNLIVNRTAHTSGNVWVLSSASTNIDFIGSKTYMTSASAGDYIASLACTVRNLWVKGTGTSIRGIYGGVLSSCYAEVTGGGYAIVQLFPNATDCTGISVSGRGFYVYEDGVLIRCYGKSTSDYGMFCETSGSNILLYNCIVLSSSGVALYLRGCKVYNTICISSSNTAIFCAFSNNQLFNCSARSASGVGIGGQSGDIINNSSAISDGNYTVGGITIRNSSIINNWNNASGHAYSTPSASSEIANNYMSVTNASANCLYNASGVSVKYANNAFKGSTTPVNANVTQAIVNTQDNQGNILL